MSEQTPEAPAPTEVPETLQPDPSATEQVHESLADAAKRLVKSIEGIYDDNQLRGEVITAKNAVRDLLARLEGDKQSEQASDTPPEGQS